ncbi:MAG TPA: O-antigen ligase family protein [Usitatibacter sp.]|jgi:O-antigen ligase|nr:O-antigen ligase family protein [Usitatibacter sp.]
MPRPIETSSLSPARLDRLRSVAAAAFLFLAPFPASAGWRLFALLVAAAALVAQAVRAYPSALPPRLPRAVAITAAAWIAICVISLAWSENARYTLGELQGEILYGALAFAVFYAGTREPRDVHIAVRVLLAGALLLGFFEWLRFALPDVRYAPRYEAIQGYFSTHLVMVAALLTFLAWPRPLGLAAPRGVLILVAIGLVLAGAATENRMLWFAVAAGALVAYAAYRHAFPSSPAALRAWLAGFAVIVLFAFASWWHKAETYYPQAADAAAAVTFDQRPLIWRSALSLAVQKPVLGHGYGREIVGDAIEKLLVAGGLDLPFRHGHNVFIDAVLQVGVAGLAIFVALLASLALTYARALRRPDLAPVGIAGLALLAGYVVKNLTDDFHHRPDSMVFWALQGLLLSLATRPRRAA